MTLEVAGAVAAGVYAGSLYLNAKFNILDDLGSLYRVRRAAKDFDRAASQNRLSLWYVVETVFKSHWHERAIWTRERSLSFGECYVAIVKYANWLLSLGAGPEECVAVYMKNCPEFILLWYATICIGAFPALVNYNLEGDSFLHCLGIIKTRLLLTGPDEDIQFRIRQSEGRISDLGIRTIVIDEKLEGELATISDTVPDDSYRKHVVGETPFCLMYTSGTTGLPKACALSHRKILMTGVHLDPALGSVPGRHCWYNPMPMYHGTGGITSTTTLLSGVGIALAPRFSVSRFWTDVHDAGATHFVYVGETARYLLNAPPHPLERSHKLVCAYGNGLRPDIWKRFKERFNIPEVAEFFNQTEGMFTLLNWNRGLYQVGCVGRHGLIRRILYHNTYVPVLVDYETGDIWRDPKTGYARRVPYEDGGEILVALPTKQAFQVYWNSPEASAKKFCVDVFKKGDIYYRTGDVLRRNADGLWYFVDRLGDTFRWKSENVSTAQVAEVMGQFWAIQEANIYGVDLPHHEGRAGCAAVQLHHDFQANPDYRALVEHLSARLPSYAVPVFLRMTRTGSHTHNYKQSKASLRLEGVNPKMIGAEVSGGEHDKFLWLPPKHDTYVPFTQADWDNLMTSKARL